VKSLAVFEDHLVIAGQFERQDDPSVRTIVAFDGHEVVPLAPYHESMETQTGPEPGDWADGFLVGGNLEVIDGVPAAGLASWNGEEWQEVGGGVRQQANPGFSLSGGHVAGVVVDDVGRLHVGGWFTHVGDRTSTNYAIYDPSGPVVRVDDPIDGESPASSVTARLRAVPNPSTRRPRSTSNSTGCRARRSTSSMPVADASGPSISGIVGRAREA
jgi:hypothetical protein